MGSFDLRPLFSERVLGQRLLDPGHTSHTNHVWLVRLADHEVVVRTNVGAGELDGPFWWGCNYLFGSDPRRVADLACIHQALLRAGCVPVPPVLRTAGLGYERALPRPELNRARPVYRYPYRLIEIQLATPATR